MINTSKKLLAFSRVRVNSFHFSGMGMNIGWAFTIEDWAISLLRKVYALMFVLLVPGLQMILHLEQPKLLHRKDSLSCFVSTLTLCWVNESDHSMERSSTTETNICSLPCSEIHPPALTMKGGKLPSGHIHKHSVVANWLWPYTLFRFL